MDRKYLKDLIEWNNDDDRKPLLVLGARQVGKTYLIKNIFAENYYKNSYLRIDCSNDSDFVDYVFKNDNLSKVIDYIQVHYNFILDNKHLLIIDEAQECLPIIKMMKHFCEERRDIPLIVSGSLVRIRINRYAHKRGKYADKSFLFPVGKINQLMIYPMTFDEFLYNYQKNTYDFVKKSFDEKKELNNDIHCDLINIFNEFLFVGGMPEVVNVFIKNKDNKVTAYQKVSKKLKEIYTDYLSDMDLYQASAESILRSRLIFRNIYSQLNKENKNFKCSVIQDNLKNRDLITPIEWLVTANVVNRSFLLKERITLPLIESEESLYRLYLSDMGLFTCQSRLNAQNFVIDKSNALSGIYYENYISIELVARGFALFYWKGKRNSELEFIIDIDGSIVPIDAKKKNGSLNSIEEFRTHNKKDLVIKVSTNHYGFDEKNKILTLPYYYFAFYLNDLKAKLF